MDTLVVVLILLVLGAVAVLAIYRSDRDDDAGPTYKAPDPRKSQRHDDR